MNIKLRIIILNRRVAIKKLKTKTEKIFGVEVETIKAKDFFVELAKKRQKNPGILLMNMGCRFYESKQEGSDVKQSDNSVK